MLCYPMFVMMCYVMLFYVILCYAMLCYVCYVMLCYDMLCYMTSMLSQYWKHSICKFQPFWCFNIGNIVYSNFSRFGVLRTTVQTNRAHAINFSVISILEAQHIGFLLNHQMLTESIVYKHQHPGIIPSSSGHPNVISILQTQHMQSLAVSAFTYDCTNSTCYQFQCCINIGNIASSDFCCFGVLRATTQTNKQSTCSQFQCYLSIGNIASANFSRFGV